MKTALVAGATGLVGNHLLHQLLNDENYKHVIIFVRRKTGIKNEKLTEHIVDFDKPENWKNKVEGDVLFSAMGTTLKKAGSKAAQRKVDYTYQFEMAEMASENGVKDYVLVSAPGASPNSWIFYNRIKGELDRDVKKLNFERVIILKPSILVGKRESQRKAEEFFAKVMKSLRWIPGLKKYRPIHGEQVARTMISSVEKNKDREYVEYSLDELF